MKIDISHLSLPDSEAVTRLKAEVRRLEGVITALADPDATLSVPAGADGRQNMSVPVAWIAFATDGSESATACLLREEARAIADKHNWCVAPLYTGLTDAEREAVERVSVAYELLPTVGAKEIAATLRALLSRTGSLCEKTVVDTQKCDDLAVKCPEREYFPALTDEEWEAVEYFASFQWTICKPHVTTLRKLLERLGGAK